MKQYRHVFSYKSKMNTPFNFLQNEYFSRNTYCSLFIKSFRKILWLAFNVIYTNIGIIYFDIIFYIYER